MSMAVDYSEFLRGKECRVPAVGFDPAPVHSSLYPFQEAIVRWAIQRGRASIFSDCGTGKTRMQLEWARQMGRRVLIAAPLCVSDQTIAEGELLGLEVRYSTEQPSEAEGIWITNYERLGGFEARAWDAIVLDESSILKSLDGKTRGRLLRDFTAVPYRLCCTATPAPNDVVELGNHAEFMGVMSRAEYLATWFVHDGDESSHGGWRLKGHAREAFWHWVATWALYVRRPSDLGFDDGGFQLPPLRIEGRVVESSYVPAGMLLPIGTPNGVRGRHEARRSTLDDRVRACAELVMSHPGQWLIWCGLNDEQDAIEQALAERCVSVQGSTSEQDRIEREARWRSGEVDVLIAKPKQFGHGMNWQHCHQMAFLGLGDSYEQYYQAIRRCWRFGQQHPVSAWVVTSNAELDVVRNVQRKERDAAELSEQIVACMREAEIAAVCGTVSSVQPYRAELDIRLPGFLE